MAKSWFDFLPLEEYRRVFDVRKFREQTEPSPEEKESWVQKSIERFREATKAAEEKRMSQALEARQREEAKVPAVQPLGIEARAIPAPRAPMAADIQKFRDATAPREAATRLREKVQPLGLERLAGKRWTPEELGWIEQYRRGEMDEETLNDLLEGTVSEAPITFVPPPVYEAAGRIPKVGKYAEPLVAGLGEPWNLAGGLTPSLAKVGGIGLGVTAGQAIEEKRMPTATELALAVGTPLVLGAAGKAIPAAVRGVREVAASPEIASFRRAIGATLAEERGGLKLPGEEPVSPDIASFRAATEITPGMSKAERLAQWKAGYKPEAAAPEAPIRGPQPVGKEEALARWRAGLEGGKPPTPPEPPTTAEAAGGIPPESAGTRFVAPLREFDDVVAEVVTSDNPLVRALVGKTGINPSVLNDTPVGKALTAYWRQRVSGEALPEVGISPALDVHAQMFTGRTGGVFTIRPTGEIRNLTAGEGQSRIWQDVFSRPDDYALKPAQRAFIDDFNTVTREVEAMRVEAGLKPRALKSKEGWLYVPRQVKTIRGVELRRPSNPGLQRIYEEAQEGMAAGVEYSASPRATLEIHVRAAYREIAEKQLADALEPLSITPKELIPEPVRIRMEEAVKGRLTAERQLRTLNREYLKAAAKGKAGWPKREAGLAEMRVGLERQKAAVETAKGQYWQAKKSYTRAMESARKAEVAHGNLFGQADETIPIASWRNRFFPRDQADALNEGLGTFLKAAQRASPFARGVEILGNYTRFLSAIGDFAEPFVQGLPTFAYRPVVWAKAAVRHYQAFLDPTVQARFMRNHLETFQKMAQSGTPIGDPEFFAALTRGGGMSPGKLLEILPKGEEARRLLQLGGRQSFGRFQASYNMGMGSNRALLYESLKPAWKGTESELWQHIRNMTGGLDTRALGVGPSQRGFESMWLGFSPRLLRSTAALVTSAARPTTPQGQAALQALVGLCSAATGIYVLTGLKLGKSWEEIETGLNPLSGKKFMSHEINGDWIGIGGQVRAIVQFVGHSVSSIAPGGEPIENFISTNQMENPILSFYSSRGAPAVNIVGGVVEAGTGANVLPFDQVDSLPNLLKHLGTSALPFALQGRLEGEQWGTTLASLVGFRTQAQSIYEKRDEARNKAAVQMAAAKGWGNVKSWADLNRGQQDEVRAASAEMTQLETKATEQGAGRGYDYSQRTEAYQKVKDTMAQQGERLLDADPTGKQWVTWRKDTGTRLSERWDALTEQFKITEEPREPQFLEDQLAERYWNLEPDANNDGMIDDAEGLQYDTNRKAILAEATAAGVSEDYIKVQYRGRMWKNNPRLQAIEEQYQQAKDIAAEYYSIPAKLGFSAEEEAELAPWATQAADMKSTYHYSPRRALEKLGLDADLANRVLRYMNRAANPARARFWRENPDKKILYKQFYSDLPLEVPAEELVGVQ